MSIIIRNQLLVILLVLGGCLHNRALERQCNQLRSGMPFAAAYSTVTAATPVCSYHTVSRVNEDVPACMALRTEVPASVTWALAVLGSARPDGCRIDILDGRVVNVSIWRGNVPE